MHADTVIDALSLVAEHHTTPGLMLAGAAVGVASGTLLHNPVHAGAASAALGAAIPFLSKTPATAGSLALAMITSTAVGLIVNDAVHHSFTKKLEEQKKPHWLSINAESFRNL